MLGNVSEKNWTCFAAGSGHRGVAGPMAANTRDGDLRANAQGHADTEADECLGAY